MIEINNVSFSYNNKTESSQLKEITLRIKKGECVLLVGKSGSGKTTITRLINGLIPHYYEGDLQGNVRLNGKSTYDCTMVELSKIIGSVFQNPRSQFFNLDTITEIAFGLENHGLSREDIHKRVEETVKELDIEYLIGKKIFSLSGGEKQIIAIASTYALGSEIFVLDEPSANLDFEAINNLGIVLKKLKEKGKTIIISEHRVYYTREIFDRCIYIEKGSIKYEFDREKYFSLSKDEIEQLGLRTMCLDTLELINCNEESLNQKKKSVFIDSIQAKYKSSDYILKDVSFELKSGEVCCLIGKNGAGKSTLANVVCGLMKERGGTIRNEKILKVKDRVGNFYLIMQESGNQLFSDSVLGELKLSFVDKLYSDDELIDLLRHFSLDNYIDRHPLSLSGGEKQRLAIATSIVANSNIIVFDEPTSGLDYENMIKVKGIIKNLKNANKYVLIITHDYEFILQISDKVVILEEGKIVKDFSLNADNFVHLKNYYISERN